MRRRTGGLLAGIAVLLAAATGVRAEVVEVDLTIATREVDFTGKRVEALTVNGGIPGPTLEFTEGDVARIHVRNDLDVPSSVHWHGLLLPQDQDGVPALTFPGIAPHTTFTYEFPLRHAGTYWYHSHSGLQEQRGVYGAIVIHPEDGDPHPADREHVVVLSDWTDENPDWVMGLLKSGNEWYAIERGTNQHLFGAIRSGRLLDFLRREWASMPDNDISDVAYDRFLANGRGDLRLAAEPGETVKLRIVNAGAASYFYLQFAGGPMTVVAADGQDVEPVEHDRLLMAIAETYDVLVTVPDEGAFEFRATAQDGSGHVTTVVGSGDLVPAPDVPAPDYYRNAMNAGYLRTAWRTAFAVRGEETVEPAPAAGEHAHHHPPDHAGMDHGGMHHAGMEMDMEQPGRPAAPYESLRAPRDTTIARPTATRTIELNLTGDMDRYVWSMNGQTLRPSNTIRIHKGERVRFRLENRTMMHHPMHLHGHFFRVLNGQGERSPLKHTVDVAPMTTTVIEFDANEEKDWFFHCHVLYHMKGGMSRVVHYEGTEVDAATAAVRPRLYRDHWYAFGGAAVLSQMTEGRAEVSNTRNVVGTDFEIGYGDPEYDVTATYSRYINRYLSPFAGVNAYEEHGVQDVRGVFGVHALLPFNVHTTLWAGTEPSFRWTAEREIHLTSRLVGFAEVEYDTETDWEWTAGGEFILTRHLSVVGQYSSDYGAGLGVRVRLHTPGF